MLFFRSEEAARVWCEERESVVRPLVTMPKLWQLSTTWYGTRLQEESRRPQPDEMRQIFANIGLTGDFWNPQSDSFG
jgi:hypothetical protein